MAKKINAVYDLTVVAPNGDKYGMHFVCKDLMFKAALAADAKGLTTDYWDKHHHGVKVERTEADVNDYLDFLSTRS